MDKNDLIRELAKTVKTKPNLENIGTRVDSSTGTIYSDGNIAYTYADIQHTRNELANTLAMGRNNLSEEDRKLYNIALAVFDYYLDNAISADKLVAKV